MSDPVIGITLDNLDNTRDSGRYDVGIGYSRCVSEAGGVPVLLPHEQDQIGNYLERCDGFILTGGVDPDTTAFGQPVHPKARVMDPDRQAFELALLEALDSAPEKPVLGVCLGMQLMALRAGGSLDQYMPDNHPADVIETHRKAEHEVTSDGVSPLLPKYRGVIRSNHQQAVTDPGSMRVVARSIDGIIEAIDAPSRGKRFYIGVQWHPERADRHHGTSPLNGGLFRGLVSAAKQASSASGR